MSFPRTLVDSVDRVASGDRRRGESKEAYSLSSMDSCFRRNDNLAGATAFAGLAKRLGKCSPVIKEMTPVVATKHWPEPPSKLGFGQYSVQFPRASSR